MPTRSRRAGARHIARWLFARRLWRDDFNVASLVGVEPREQQRDGTRIQRAWLNLSTSR